MKFNKLKIIYILGGCWLFGIGFRMITQFLYGNDWIMGTPQPVGNTWATWDYWFDWFPMVVLGLVFFYLAFASSSSPKPS